MPFTSFFSLRRVPIHDFFTAANTFDSAILFFMGFVFFTSLVCIPICIGLLLFERKGNSYETLSILIFSFFAMALSSIIFSYEAQGVYSKVDARVEENIRIAVEQKVRSEEEKIRREKAFAYANNELRNFVDALGGKSFGCSNYRSKEDFMSCSLATEKDLILEVKCPSIQGVHGCFLAESANEVLRNRGFDLNISNSNSNSNSNLQKLE